MTQMFEVNTQNNTTISGLRNDDQFCFYVDNPDGNVAVNLTEELNEIKEELEQLLREARR